MKTARQGQAPRLVVAYVGGGWTDKLAVERYGVAFKDNELTLRIDVAPREGRSSKEGAHDAFREFMARCTSVESLQIARRSIARKVKESARMAENAEISVKLAADGREVVYPAALTFGPDNMTITLG